MVNNVDTIIGHQLAQKGNLNYVRTTGQKCEKSLQLQESLYHVFINFKKPFDRVLHAAFWSAMKLYNIITKLIHLINKPH
jgi:UDP-N-acetylglucosamine:LPS N-acetylglucosamine transferase